MAGRPTSGAVAVRPAGWTTNNFDLLRLFAASQVVWYHSVLLLAIGGGHWLRSVNRVTDTFPGVPMFFVMSGFLVSASYERSKSTGDYALKRALRVYPGLWLCFVFTVAVLAGYGFLTGALVRSDRFPAWVLAQLTVATTTPRALRGFGTGTPNGSLWTISVELGFYLLLPFIYRIIERLPGWRADIVLLGLGAFSVVGWCFARSLTPTLSNVSIQGLFHASPFPYLWMFFLGIEASRHLAAIRRFVEGKGLFYLAGYILVTQTVLHHGFVANGPLACVEEAIGLGLLGLTTISLAYTVPKLAHRVLRGNDFSYGVYLYHYIWINIAVESLPGRKSLKTVAFVAACTAGCAVISWYAVERPGKRAQPAAARIIASVRRRKAPLPLAGETAP